MRIILDTEKKTITVPWNYTDKLAAMNKTIKEAMGEPAKTLDFKGYLDDCWKYAMEHSDEQLKTRKSPPSGRKMTRRRRKAGMPNILEGDKTK